MGRDDRRRWPSQPDFLESCTPGYYNNEGKPGERSLHNGFYGAGPVAFFKVLDDWRADGDLAGWPRAHNLNRSLALPPTNLDRSDSGNEATRSLRSWTYSGVWSAWGNSDAHKKCSTP